MSKDDDIDPKELLEQVQALEDLIVAKVGVAGLGPKHPRSDASFLGSFQSQRNETHETVAVSAPVTATTESETE